MREGLIDKVGVVSGGTSGIGLEVVNKLLAKGMRIYVLGRNFDSLKVKLKEHDNSANCEFLPIDMNRTDQIREGLAELNKEAGIDVLIHCSGVISLSTLEKGDISDLDEQYRINLRAPYLITQILIPKIRMNTGQILFLNSTAGLRSWEKIGQYASTKFGLRALADSLREELKTERIKVSSLYLGSVDTPMQKKVQKIRGKEYQSHNFMDPAEIAKIVFQLLCLPEDIEVKDITISSK